MDKLLAGEFDFLLPSMHQIQKDAPMKFYGFDKQGHAMITFESGKLDPELKDAMYATTILSLLQLNYIVEKYPETRKSGFVFIEDHGGLTMAHYKLMILDMGMHKIMMKFFDGGFPMRVMNIWITNEPSFFSVIFKLIKPFMSQKMLDRIHVVGPDKEQVIDYLGGPQYGPEFLGGTADILSKMDDVKLEDELRKVLPFDTATNHAL